MSQRQSTGPADVRECIQEPEKTPGAAEGERGAIEVKPSAPARTPGKAEGERGDIEEVQEEVTL